MPTGWWMWPTWWVTACDLHARAKRPGCLYGSDGGLLGLHADRWRPQDASAAAFSHPGLQPRAAGLSLCAVRDRGHGHQPVSGLDRRAVWPYLDAVCRAWLAGGGVGGVDA